jgi:feruloyl esterase
MIGLAVPLTMAAFTNVATAQTACERLTSLSLPNTTITSAQAVAAGAFTPPGASANQAQAYRSLPAFCRVTATVKPTPSSDIRMEVWMPATGWSGTFQGNGSAGIGGAIPYGDLAASLRAGYATAGSDTGHQGDSTYALTQPERVIDFGDRAGHEVPVKAKAIMNAFYGRGPGFSFINGCGGSAQTAQLAAQKYPLDYDAIAITGWSDKTHHIFHQMWMWDATHRDEASYIPAEKFNVLNASVIKACDALDGVVDGVLEDPRQCKFDPEQIQCAAGADGPNCLTPPQVQAVRKIYAGPRNPFTQQRIFPGPQPGSELTWYRFVNGQRPFDLAADFFKYFVFKDPNWDYNRRPVNFHSDVTLADRPENLVANAPSPDIRQFVARGGKLLMWEGWNDTSIPPDAAIDWYNNVVSTVGARAAKESVRLFMVPGKLHCGFEGSHGTFDVGAELKKWVDSGRAPDRIIISGTAEGNVPRTRPLCPFPQVATYTGNGSTNDAANFTCNTPK